MGGPCVHVMKLVPIFHAMGSRTKVSGREAPLTQGRLRKMTQAAREMVPIRAASPLPGALWGLESPAGPRISRASEIHADDSLGREGLCFPLLGAKSRPLAGMVQS